MNFISRGCLSVINVYFINLKEHKTKKVKCKIINWYAVLECACLLTRFFCDMFPLLLPNRCCLGENNHKSQSVIEFLLCVASIKDL